MGRLKKAIQRRVTIRDIAALAKVSIGTVDRVLHKRGEVNQETHDRVMAYVDELRYRPNLLAKSLALKKSFSIAVLIPDAGDSNYYWKKPLEGFKSASEELNDFNTKIEIFHYDPAEEKTFIRELNRIIALKPNGIVLAPNFHEAALQLMPSCKAAGIPCMFIDNDLEDQGLAYFGQDALQSGIVAAKLMHYGLPENAKVLVLNVAAKKAITPHMTLREQGFVNYFKSNNTTGNYIQTQTVCIDLSNDKEPHYTLKKLLPDDHDISGVFVTNSKVHKVASYLSTYGKGSLMLIGYDLVDPNMQYLEQGIINFLIGQKPEEQGYKCAMAMFDFLLTGKLIGKINYSPIDIIMKENINYYKNTNI
jgi:LacI family transcriptional regulator